MEEVLWLIPIIHFAIIYFLAKREHILPKLRRNYAIMYLDWLFILVDWSLTANHSFSFAPFMICFLICAIPIYYLNKGWRNSKQKKKETTLFFNPDESMNKVGITHTVFMLIQGALSLLFFISSTNNLAYLAGIISLVIYFAAYCVIIKRIRKLRFVHKVEMPYVIAGLVLAIMRLVLALCGLTFI